MSTTYIDRTTCPKGHRVVIRRRTESAGKIISTRCAACGGSPFLAAAGPLPTGENAPKGPTNERQIEARLVKRVKELGGECRKVQWIGRRGAPDRIVMLPGFPAPVAQDMRIIDGRTLWVELKAPGRAATFPKNAHEKAQHREHERMRKMGQRVEVVDSYEQIEELLK